MRLFFVSVGLLPLALTAAGLLAFTSASALEPTPARADNICGERGNYHACDSKRPSGSGIQRHTSGNVTNLTNQAFYADQAPDHGPVSKRGSNAAAVTVDNDSGSCAPAALKVGIKHYRYQEASAGDLVNIGGGHRLHRDAAAALRELQAAARKDGVSLIVGSAFRSVEYQRGIVRRKKSRGMSDQQIYYLSSAPGFSEHHTGFTVDFSPIEYRFENSAAYRWLTAHAPAMGWQQSFTKASSQLNGVSHEPWHWKYLGTQAAKAALTHGECGGTRASRQPIGRSTHPVIHGDGTDPFDEK